MVYLSLPIKNGDFPWRTVSHNQIVRTIMELTEPPPIPRHPQASPHQSRRWGACHHLSPLVNGVVGQRSLTGHGLSCLKLFIPT